MIRLTLAAMPRRLTVLAAKAAVITGCVLAASVVAVLGSVLAGRLILPGHGLSPANGYQLLSLGNAPDLRATAGAVLYLALIALLAVGLTTAVRDAGVAIGTVLGLLYLFPIVSSLVPDQNAVPPPRTDRSDDGRPVHRGHHRRAGPAAHSLARPGCAGPLGARRPPAGRGGPPPS